MTGLETSSEDHQESRYNVHSFAWGNVRLLRLDSVVMVFMGHLRAVAASIARLVIYIEILHATEADVELDTNR